MRGFQPSASRGEATIAGVLRRHRKLLVRGPPSACPPDEGNHVGPSVSAGTPGLLIIENVRREEADRKLRDEVADGVARSVILKQRVRLGTRILASPVHYGSGHRS